MADLVRLVREPIDLAALSGVSPADGALCLFVGVVRNENRGRAVVRLEYQAYEEMALPLMERIAQEARERFPVTEVRLVHRLGTLEVGEVAVAVVAATAHRGEAFDACRYVIEELKKRVPIWKKEYYIDGSVDWVDPTAPRG